MCDLTITQLAEDRFWVVTGGGVGKHDLAWMRRNLPADGSVHLHDRTSGLCCARRLGARWRAGCVQSVSEDDLSNEAFPYMTARDFHVDCVPVRALRISYVGELGWEIYAPTEFGPQLWDTLWGAGEPLGAVACGGAAYDSLRLEKGYRLWGQDIDEEHDPYEAGLGWAVRLGKDADFIGRAAAAEIKERGVRRRLCCMVAEDPSLLLVGTEALLDGDRRARVRHERRLRRDGGGEHPLRLPAGLPRRGRHIARRMVRGPRASGERMRRAALRPDRRAPAGRGRQGRRVSARPLARSARRGYRSRRRRPAPNPRFRRSRRRPSGGKGGLEPSGRRSELPFPAGRRERESRGRRRRKEHRMTTQRSFKRLVRARMEKTGESYTAARARC